MQWTRTDEPKYLIWSDKNCSCGHTIKILPNTSGSALIHVSDLLLILAGIHLILVFPSVNQSKEDKWKTPSANCWPVFILKTAGYRHFSTLSLHRKYNTSECGLHCGDVSLYWDKNVLSVQLSSTVLSLKCNRHQTHQHESSQNLNAIQTFCACICSVHLKGHEEWGRMLDLLLVRRGGRWGWSQ